MKTLIIYKSIHHGNTKKVARVIAKQLKAQMVVPEKVQGEDLKEYDLLGFGSGIYFGKYHQKILALVDSLPNMSGKKAFLFATSGTANGILHPQGFFDFHRTLEQKLKKKGSTVLGRFDCRGWDTYVLKSLGGISKGRPNTQDLEQARKFAKKIQANCA